MRKAGEGGAKAIVHALDDPAKVAGDLIEQAGHERGLVGKEAAVKSVVGPEVMVQGVVRVVNRGGDDRVLGWTDKHHARQAPFHAANNLRRGVDVMGLLDLSRQLCDPESRIRETVARTRVAFDHDFRLRVYVMIRPRVQASPEQEKGRGIRAEQVIELRAQPLDPMSHARGYAGYEEKWQGVSAAIRAVLPARLMIEQELGRIDQGPGDILGCGQALLL